MITAQDIRERTFERARVGGYDAAAVDDFLDQLAEEVAASQKENSVLKAKMKVLVEKIEEYRGNEEALNRAVLSAQKLAVQIEKEAKDRAAAMIADAEEKVKARLGSIEEEEEREKQNLAEAKDTTAKFFDAVRALCKGQLQQLDEIVGDFVPEAEPEVEVEIEAEEEPEADPAADDLDSVAAQLGLDGTQDFDL